MSFFQLILFMLAGIIFYLFFKKLFGSDYPKRGVDFEAKLPNENIGGISTSDKIFSKPITPTNRIDDLMDMAKKSIDINDFDDASKALQSALILEPDNIELLHMAGYVAIQSKNIDLAKEYYNKILLDNENDDLAHASLANVLHINQENEESIIHHKKSIEIDGSYAKHYYNYANTLYDLDKIDEAIVNYKKAFELDSHLIEAKDMIDKLIQDSQS